MSQIHPLAQCCQTKDRSLQILPVFLLPIQNILQLVKGWRLWLKGRKITDPVFRHEKAVQKSLYAKVTLPFSGWITWCSLL